MPLPHFYSDPRAYSVLYQVKCGAIIHVHNGDPDALENHKKNCPICNKKILRKEKLKKLKDI
jgi:hypothetical protein